MTTAEGSRREARRRRIAERGSDRLALITGKIQSMPSQSDQSPPAAEDEALSLPVHDSGREASEDPIVNEALEILLPNRDKGSSIASRAVSLLGLEKEILQVSSSIQSSVLEHQEEPQSHCRSLTLGQSIASRAVSLLGLEKEISQVSSSIQSSTTVLEHQDEPQSHHSSLTTGQIRSAIPASENIRMYCSIAAAVLVILSYIGGLPIMGWSTVFRPVYLLLLTNVSIVLTRLILGTQGAELRTGQTSSFPTFGGNGLFDQMGKALEVGLLLQDFFGALFIDFSIYALVLVCGLSLVRSLGL
ncbi:hypothetical protein ACJIZ3_001546 [Penstemon smallii]|uniref:Uncharacterized protein n=1 Tax=Penstemon smallii TaxID=265156 RepID=A0ABD3U7H5_9LAMI